MFRIGFRTNEVEFDCNLSEYLYEIWVFEEGCIQGDIFGKLQVMNDELVEEDTQSI